MLWFKKDDIHCIFEVENTTAITKAIVRGSNLPSDSVRRFMVLPEEREKLLYRKLQQPMLVQRVQRDRWKFIFYKDLNKLFETPKSISLESITNIAREAKPESSQGMLEFS